MRAITREENHEYRLVRIENDLIWIKWVVGLGLGALISLHFVDPSVHYGIFQFP